MGYDRSEEDLKLIADTRARIDELFTVVVVGEFNSGKSSFINCLVGKKICEEGVIPTTSKICIIRSNSHTGGGGEKTLSGGKQRISYWKMWKRWKWILIGYATFPS